MKVKHTFVMVFESDDMDIENLTPLKEKFKALGITNIHFMLVPDGTKVTVLDLYQSEGEL